MLTQINLLGTSQNGYLAGNGKESNNNQNSLLHVNLGNLTKL